MSWSTENLKSVLRLLEMVQIYTDRTTTTLKSSAFIAILVLAALFNVTKDFKRFLIDHSYTLIPLLSISGTLIDVD